MSHQAQCILKASMYIQAYPPKPVCSAFALKLQAFHLHPLGTTGDKQGFKSKLSQQGKVHVNGPYPPAHPALELSSQLEPFPPCPPLPPCCQGLPFQELPFQELPAKLCWKLMLMATRMVLQISCKQTTKSNLGPHLLCIPGGLGRIASVPLWALICLNWAWGSSCSAITCPASSTSLCLTFFQHRLNNMAQLLNSSW